MPYAMPRQTSGLAIASLILTLSTFVTCIPLCIGGIICGALALKDTGPEGTKSGRAMAQWGLWLGVVLTFFYVAMIALVVMAAVHSP
jgi:hypothetical protein